MLSTILSVKSNSMGKACCAVGCSGVARGRGGGGGGGGTYVPGRRGLGAPK